MFWERKVAPGAVCQPSSNALRNPRRALLLVGLLLIVGITLVGCGRSQSAAAVETKDDYQVTFATEPAPPDQGAGTVIIRIRNAAGQGVQAEKVAVEANMNHAGMVPENAESTSGADGEYRMPLDWTMGGAWFVDVEITLPGGEVIRRRFDVDVR